MLDAKQEQPNPSKRVSNPPRFLPTRNSSSPVLNGCPPSLLLPAFSTPGKDSLHPEQASTDLSNLLWAVLTTIFLAFVLVLPLVMVWLGNPHGMRYLLRLGAMLGIFAAIISLACLFSGRRR